MQGPQQKFSPSNHHPTIAAASPKPSLTDPRESNENDSGQGQTIPMLQSTKKTAADYLVSPAVSAAFDAAAPRRKIQVETSENSSSFEGQSHKTSDFVPKGGSPGILIPSEHLSPIILLYNSDYDGEVDGNTEADSYLKADPYRKYISPMPNFVRLDPNRCEILHFQAKEVAGDLPGSCNVDKDEELEPQDVKDSFQTPGKESTEKQEIEENSEKGVEKIEEEEEFEERGWCLRGVVEFMLILIAYSLSISYMCSMNSPAPATNSQVNWSLKNDYLIKQSCTVETSTMKLYDTGFLAVGVEDCYANKVETNEGERHAKEEMIQNIAVTFEDREDDNVTDEEAETKDESLDKYESEFEKFAQSISAKAVENEDDYDCGMDMDVDDSDDDNLDERDGALETEVVGIEVESKIEILEKVSGPETRKSEDSGGYESEKKENAFNQSGDFEISAKSYVTEFEDENAGHFVHEVDEVGYDEVETEIKGWNTLTIIGVSLASIVLGSITFIFVSDKARTTSTEKSQSSREPNECAVEESATTVFPAVEERVKSRAGPSLLLSMDEAFKELSFQIHAPKVELIGELVVGEVNGSFPGYSRKKHMIQSAESINHLIQPAIASNRPSVPEISTMNSENKITNEGKKNAEEAKLIVTPVRRSNRIRNRALAMSP